MLDVALRRNIVCQLSKNRGVSMPPKISAGALWRKMEADMRKPKAARTKGPVRKPSAAMMSAVRQMPVPSMKQKHQKLRKERLKKHRDPKTREMAFAHTIARKKNLPTDVSGRISSFLK